MPLCTHVLFEVMSPYKIFLNVVLFGQTTNTPVFRVEQQISHLHHRCLAIFIAFIMLPFQLSRLYSRHVFRRLFSATQDSFSKSNRGHRCQSCLLLDSTKNSLSYRNIATSTTSLVFQKSTKPEVKDQPTYMM